MTQAIKEGGIDLDGFLTIGVSAALRQLLEFGLFHGDPHPGNIFAMRDGRIAYVDFGNVAVLSEVIIHILSMEGNNFVSPSLAISNCVSLLWRWCSEMFSCVYPADNCRVKFNIDRWSTSNNIQFCVGYSESALIKELHENSI